MSPFIRPLPPLFTLDFRFKNNKEKNPLRAKPNSRQKQTAITLLLLKSKQTSTATDGQRREEGKNENVIV